MLEKHPSSDNRLLETLVKDVKPIGWEALRELIPDWTANEKAHNERVWEAIEAEKRAAAERGSDRLRQVEALFGSEDDADQVAEETHQNQP